jgi:beta-lactamase regulating signal transducer with metallopeptidase domain
MSDLGLFLLTLGLSTLAAGALAWAVGRLAETALKSPRHTVWIWRAARLAVIAPGFALALAMVAPNFAPAPAQTGVLMLELPMVQLPFEAVQPVVTAAQSAAAAAAAAWPAAGLLLLVAYGVGLAAALVRALGRRAALAGLLSTAHDAPDTLERQAAAWRERLGLRADEGELRMVDGDLSPFVTGLKPIIVMPRSLVEAPGADMALAHELMHVRRGDERDRLIGEVLTTLYWFNPFSVWIERRLAGARELACDADLLDALGASSRAVYARALTDAAPVHGEARLQCAFLTDCKGLRVRRVKAILAHAGSAKGGRLAAGFSGALVLLAAAPAAAAAWWASAEPGAALEQSAQPTATSARQDEALSTEVGEAVLAIQAETEARNFAAAIDMATQGLSGESLTAHERSVLLRQRAGAHFQSGDHPAAIEDFERAIATGALGEETRGQILLNLGQLYAFAGDYDRAIISMQGAADMGVAFTPRLSRLIAQIFVQVERFEEAKPYAEEYFASLEAPDYDDAQLTVFIYNQLGQPEEALTAFERYFLTLETPEERDLLQLVNLLNAAGRTEEAQRIWDVHGMAELAREAIEEGGR